MERFDEEVVEALAVRHKFNVDLKLLEIKLLVLAQEIELLKEFEVQDKLMVEKIEAKKAEKLEYISKVLCQAFQMNLNFFR
jgi:hypothetical protein